MLLMFFVSTVSAGNSGGEPKSGAVSSVKKSSTVAVVANSVPSNATCPSFNNGSITTTVTSTGAAQPYVLTALLYAGTPPTPPAIGTAIGTSPPLTLPAATVFTGLVAGTYTVRVLVIDPTTGGVLEFFDQVVVVGTTPDATAPTFAGAANITVAAGANCQFTPAVTGGIGTRTVTTNVGITVSEDCSNISSVTFSPAGPFLNGTTTAVTVTATSPGGTSNTVVNVTVRDLTPPTFTTCPANATFAIAACATTAVITFAPPVITDNCTPPNLIGSIELGPATGSALPAGVYNVSYTATDAAGNQSTCTFSITVTPPVNPPLVCAATTATSTTVPIGACANTTTLMYTLNPPTGGCPPIVMVSAIGPASGTVVGPGTYTVGGTYRGAAGQTIVCTTDIVVAAPTRPAIVCGALTNSTQPITVCNTTTTLNYLIAAPTGGCAPLTLVEIGRAHV